MNWSDFWSSPAVVKRCWVEVLAHRRILQLALKTLLHILMLTSLPLYSTHWYVKFPIFFWQNTTITPYIDESIMLCGDPLMLLWLYSHQFLPSASCGNEVWFERSELRIFTCHFFHSKSIFISSCICVFVQFHSSTVNYVANTNKNSHIRRLQRQHPHDCTSPTDVELVSLSTFVSSIRITSRFIVHSESLTSHARHWNCKRLVF